MDQGERNWKNYTGLGQLGVVRFGLLQNNNSTRDSLKLMSSALREDEALVIWWCLALTAKSRCCFLRSQSRCAKGKSNANPI